MSIQGRVVDEELPRAAPPRVARSAKDLSILDLIGQIVPRAKSSNVEEVKANDSVSTTTTPEVAAKGTIAACPIDARSSSTMAVEALVNAELCILCT